MQWPSRVNDIDPIIFALIGICGRRYHSRDQDHTYSTPYVRKEGIIEVKRTRVQINAQPEDAWFSELPSGRSSISYTQIRETVPPFSVLFDRRQQVGRR